MYTSYFGKFPTIQYDMEQGKYSVKETVTDMFFRLGMIKEALSNSTSYYVIELEDSDTPEVLAEKIYGDAGAGWIILYANKVMDPQYEWPLDHNSFDRYLVEKYRYAARKAYLDSITINNPGTGYSNGFIRLTDGSGVNANASASVNATGSIVSISINSTGDFYKLSDNMTANVSLLGGTGANLTVNLVITDDRIREYTQTFNHHFEKIITRTDPATDQSYETRFRINQFRYTVNAIQEPYDYYEPYSVTIGLTADTTLYTSDNTDYAADFDVSQDYTEGGGGETEAGADADAESFLYSGAVFKTERREVVNIDGKTIIQTTRGEPVTFYKYESDLNESRRLIKVVKKEYYKQIIDEFNNLTGWSEGLVRRTLI